MICKEWEIKFDFIINYIKKGFLKTVNNKIKFNFPFFTYHDFKKVRKLAQSSELDIVKEKLQIIIDKLSINMKGYLPKYLEDYSVSLLSNQLWDIQSLVIKAFNDAGLLDNKENEEFFPYNLILITSDIYANTNYREDVPKEPKKVISEKYVPAPIEKVEYSIEQITKALKKISKHKPEDELNCAGCGYSSCREFVNALIAGDAETSMCVSYMRKIAVRKAAAMLRCMPSAVVIVDSNMEIVEANDSFEQMFLGEMYEIFASRQDGLSGAALDRIVPFSELFKSALETGKDIHLEHYSIKEKVYDISIFTIEDNELIGAVISDVTKSEIDRSKIAKKAREVITKNIATVQEIASLLGEHMVETELLLNSIAEGFDSNISEDKK